MIAHARQFYIIPYESGFYYFKAHADEFETLTEDELSSIFPCRFRYYNVNWALGGTTGAGELYEYDAEGNTRHLGNYATDDSYRTREDINPNWPEIDGTWRIEEGKLIRTIISGNQEKQYIVKSLDRHSRSFCILPKTEQLCIIIL